MSPLQQSLLAFGHKYDMGKQRQRVVEALVDAGADVNEKFYQERRSVWPFIAEVPLHLALYANAPSGFFAALSKAGDR